MEEARAEGIKKYTELQNSMAHLGVLELMIKLSELIFYKMFNQFQRALDNFDSVGLVNYL
jgi:hypothetical protein